MRRTINIRLWTVITFMVILAYLLISGLITYLNTGSLSVKSPNSKASIMIAQINHSSEIIGVGGATVRLNPGTYEVIAFYNDRQDSQVVNISKQQGQEITLDPKTSTRLPSVNDIYFSGVDRLLDLGVSSDQISNLEMAVFEFNHTVRQVNINSISFVPHDRNSDSPMDSMNFVVKLDSKIYRASFDYSSLDDSIKLVLHDTSGQQVFDSSAADSQLGN